MWKTSFIQLLKNIQQNKFFTFLNLFGVSITIMIILIAAIKIETSIWAGGPEKGIDRMLFIQNEKIQSESHTSMGGINLILIEDYILKMKTPKAFAFKFDLPWSYFGENGVEEFALKNVNAGWWQVFDYDFIEGRAFNTEEVKSAANLIVIDEEVRNRFFSDGKALGKMLEISGIEYKISGIIKNVPGNCIQAHANVFVPYTVSEGYGRDIMQTGYFSLTFLSEDKANDEAIRAEFENIRKRLIPLLDKGYNISFGGPDGALGFYLRDWNTSYAGHAMSLLIIFLKFLFVMLLPAINLISIQLIRIHERSEEMGVRKAFGATRQRLIKQILYENTLLTFFGALLGLVFTLIIVYGMEDILKSTLFREGGNNISISINYGLFIISLITSLVLSFISGLIPALKISRVQAIDALRGGEL